MHKVLCMEDETDIKELEQALQELKEQGELDREVTTFQPMKIGGVHLDQISDVLEDVDYDRHPVRITIEPSNDIPEDHHYTVRFEDLGE